MRKTLILALAAASTMLAGGCGGGGGPGSSPVLAGPNQTSSTNRVATGAPPIGAPLTVANVGYMPHGGPFAPAAEPGYPQLAASGFDDYAGGQFWLSDANVILDKVTPLYGGALGDDRAPGSETLNSTTVIDFTMSATSYLNAVARATRAFNVAYNCSVGGSQLQLIEQNNSWRSIAMTAIAPKVGSTYAIKFDVVGSTLTCKLYDATGTLDATVQKSDTGLTAAGYNGLQYYAPDGVHGATDIRIWYSYQPDSVVGIPKAPSPISTTPTPTPKPDPSATPTTRPTDPATATPHPTATPTSAPTDGGGGAALLCVHFSSNPMCHTLPNDPDIAANSNSWAALEFGPGRDSFGGLQISNAPNPFLDPYDASEPRFEFPAGAASVQQTIHCDKESYSYTTCEATGMNGKVVDVPSDMSPEGGTDHHFSYDDFARSGEQDFWLAEMPTGNGGTQSVGGAGFCKWGTDGTGCSGSTATDIATGMGGVDAKLLKDAESDATHGALPYAISASAVCADVSTSYVYPAKSSDGDNTNGTPACAGHLSPGQRPPEGTRWFLAMHDADVNATSNAPYVKVLLRTVDEDHMGGVVTDTNWSGASTGLQMQFNRGNFAFAAAEAGVYYGTDVFLPIATNGINLATQLRFCKNGTC